MPLPVRRRDPSTQRGQRWEPFRELEQLQEATAQLLENVWSGTGLADAAVWTPLVDIEETDDAWIVEAELPGVDRDDVSVEVRESELLVTGEIKERERRGILRRRSRPTGRFEYRVTLPGAIEAEGVEATMANGVLTVRVPKSEQARPRRIEVANEPR
ncbi:MAG TPA: Hsp20/alpha crystallin family protein [Solirubrobacteraceae bacterium]